MTYGGGLTEAAEAVSVVVGVGGIPWCCVNRTPECSTPCADGWGPVSRAACHCS
jgi:hypothetical protein